MSEKLLLIEDEADISYLVQYVLCAAGFEVDIAPRVEVAEKLLAGGGIDAILLDLMLPGEDGYSYCRRLKADEQTRSIPVIVFSARTMPHEVKQALACGACGYITKPYEPASLADQVKRLLEKARAEQPKD